MEPRLSPSERSLSSALPLGLTQPGRSTRLCGCQLDSILGRQAEDAREVQELHDIQAAGTRFHGV